MLKLNLGELFGAEGEGGSMPAARIFPPPPPQSGHSSIIHKSQAKKESKEIRPDRTSDLS